MKHLALVLLLLAPGLARAEIVASAWLDFREARVRLLLDRDAPDVRAGLEIRLMDGFKTYWRNAGDSGVPPSFDFSGSENLSRLAVAFPFPARFDDGAGGMAIGYKHGVILPISGKRTGPDHRLALTLDFAVCGTMCIPLNGKLALSPAEGVAVSGEEAKALDAAVAALPKAVQDDAARVQRLDGAGGKPRWRVSLPYPGEIAGLSAFAEGRGFLDVTSIASGRPGEAVIEMSGEAEPGSNGTFGPVRLTYGTTASSFERMLDLDGAK